MDDKDSIGMVQIGAWTSRYRDFQVENVIAIVDYMINSRD